ncbi:MAG: hypothetical protein DRP74_05150 [Candidatus Omnitrophota bacterium]|nr:MAG: hypothetical protein DRP74_05150 [Candidatus Omnitrophota bacterium]
MKERFLYLTVLVLIFSSLSCAAVSNKISDGIYSVRLKNKEPLFFEALQDAKAGNKDFAIMKFAEFLRMNPNTIYAKDIKFAIAEYNLEAKNYVGAIPQLAAFIEEYPEGTRTMLARALLYKALSDYGEETMTEEYMTEHFFAKCLFLIFSESKARYYVSILDNVYKIVDYIDKVKIFKNDELYLEITP